MHLNSNLNMTQSKASPEIIARTQEEVISKEELMEVKRRRAETQKGNYTLLKTIFYDNPA